MSNMKINYKQPPFPKVISKSGNLNSNNNMDSNKENYCGQTFHEILKEKLKNDVQHASSAQAYAFQVVFNRRPVY